MKLVFSFTFITLFFYSSQAQKGKLLTTISTQLPISCIKLSPDKKIIAFADDTNDPILINPKETYIINVLNSDNFSGKFKLLGHKKYITSICFSKDSQKLVSADRNGDIFIWDLSDGKQLMKIETDEWIHNIKFSNSGNEIIAIQGYEKIALVYDIKGELIAKLNVGKQINDFEYNPVTNNIYFGCYSEFQVWSLTSRKMLHSFPFSGLMRMKFNQDYSQLAIGKSNGNIIIIPYNELYDSIEIAKYLDYEGDLLSIRHLLVSTWGETDTVIYAKAKRKIDSIMPLVNQSNFQDFIVKYSDDPGSKNKGGKYEDFMDHEMVPEIITFANNEPIGKIGCIQTKYGFHIIEVLRRKSVEDFFQDKEIYRLKGHFKPVLSVSFSFDNSRLASASSDQTARIWEIKKQNEIVQLTNEHKGTVSSIEFVSSKNTFMTGGVNQELKIWK